MASMNWRLIAACGLAVSLAGVPARAADAGAADAAQRCYASVSAGAIDFEGDESVDDGAIYSVRLGKDCTEDWSMEFGLDVVPFLTQSWRTEWDTRQRISRLQENAGTDSTWSMRFVVDGLYHFTRWEKFDPFLAVGGGLIWYADDFDHQYEGMVEGGAGCFYHLGDHWALRADARALVAGADTEANSTLTFGFAYSPGRASGSTVIVPPPAVKIVDSDGDGIADAEESAKTMTDPLNADSDFDGLSDGDELHKYMTDPRKRDTDGGGVYDGHEVIEDLSDPKAAGDDLRFFELRISFDPGDWKIKSEYYSEIAVIGKLLRDNPAAKVRIEGHMDRLLNSSERKIKDLTEKRADAVRDYLTENWKIAKSRMTAVGYGSSRPKSVNDPVKGSAENRRIEIYIRGAPAPIK